MFRICLQLTVIAYDESNNPKQTSVPVEVTIVRNQFRPEFSHPDFVTVSVNEYSPIRSTIYDVNATDADFDVPESRNVSVFPSVCVF